jgi:hypothetical protein
MKHLTLIILSLCAFNLLKLVNGFYFHHEAGKLKFIILFIYSVIIDVAFVEINVDNKKDEIEDKNGRIIKNLLVSFDSLQGETFPERFALQFQEFGEEFHIFFNRLSKNSDSNPIVSNDIYVINEQTNQPIKFESENHLSNEHDFYRQEGNTNGFATLIRNQLHNASTHPFRFIGTVYLPNDEQNAFDIYPVVISGLRDSQFDTKKNEHLISKRSLSQEPTKISNQKPSFVNDFVYNTNSESYCFILSKGT